jgi:hypothetical protein
MNIRRIADHTHASLTFAAILCLASCGGQGSQQGEARSSPLAPTEATTPSERGRAVAPEADTSLPRPVRLRPDSIPLRLLEGADLDHLQTRTLVMAELSLTKKRSALRHALHALRQATRSDVATETAAPAPEEIDRLIADTLEAYRALVDESVAVALSLHGSLTSSQRVALAVHALGAGEEGHRRHRMAPGPERTFVRLSNRAAKTMSAPERGAWRARFRSQEADINHVMAQSTLAVAEELSKESPDVTRIHAAVDGALAAYKRVAITAIEPARTMAFAAFNSDVDPSALQ